MTFENAELALKAKSAPKLEFMNKQVRKLICIHVVNFSLTYLDAAERGQSNSSADSVIVGFEDVSASFNEGQNAPWRPFPGVDANSQAPQFRSQQSYISCDDQELTIGLAGSEGTASCASQMSYLSASPEGGVAGCDNEAAGEVVPESRSNDDDKVFSMGCL